MNTLALKYRGYCVCLSLAALQAWLALFNVLATRSLEQGAALWGYTPFRFILAALLACLGLGLSLAARRAWRKPDELHRTIERLDEYLLGRGWLLPVFIALLLALIALIWGLSALTHPLSPENERYLLDNHPLLLHALDLGRAAMRRFGLLLGLCLIQLIETVLLFLVGYAKFFGTCWRDGRLLKSALLLLVSAAAAFQWGVLIFRLKTFLVVPGWKWYFHDQPVTAQHGLLALLFALLIAGSLLALNARRLSIRCRLGVILILGLLIQFGFGFVQGPGFEAIRLKYAASVFSAYAHTAATQPPLLASLRQYEDSFGKGGYLGTKPPGVLLTYALTEKLSSLITPAGTPEERFLHLTRFITWVYPWLGYLTTVALFFLARALFNSDADDALHPALLYIVTPNVALIPLFLDQALYPLLFVLLLLAAWQVIRSRSVAWAVALGAGIYLALYLSFSLLPLLPLCLTWMGVDYLQNRSQHSLLETIKMMTGLLAGVLLAYLLLRLALNYDFLYRYQSAFSQHRRIKEFEGSGEKLWNAIQLNNVEIGTWSGLPLMALCLARVLSSGWNFVRRRAGAVDSLLAAFFLTYLALNAFGQTNGEVQRLWLFMVPLFVLFAADQIRTFYRQKSSVLLFVITLQFITTALIFEFQDFYG